MVRTILKTLAQPVRGLHQAAYLLAFLALASQLLALIRDRIFAHQFGAGELLDLYYAAFKVPDVVFALVASLVSAYVLVPRIQGLGREETERLLSQCATFLVVVGGALSLVLFAFAPKLLFVLFPTYASSAYAHEFVLLSRMLLLQPILLGLSGVLSSVTQDKRKFTLFALSPVLYNAGIIGGSVLLYPHFGLLGIGYGVVAGACAHLVLHVPVLAASGIALRPRWPKYSTMVSVVSESVPRSLSLSMASLISLALISLASRVSEGAVSVYTLASNLATVPLSLIGASYATAAFPALARAHQAGNWDAYKTTLTTAARHIIFWTSVITVLAIVLRAYLVRILYGTGAFDWNDTRLTAAVFAILIVGLLAHCLILLIARAFYAAGKSWNPLMVQLADFGVSVFTAWLLLKIANTFPLIRYFFEALFRVSDVSGTDVLLIAVGAVIGQLLMLVVALLTLKQVARGVAGSLTRPMGEGFAAAILGGAAAYGVLSYLGTLAPLTSLPSVFIDGVVSGIVGLIVSGCILLLLENQEFRDLLSSLRKMSRTSLRSVIVVPDHE